MATYDCANIDNPHCLHTLTCLLATFDADAEPVRVVGVPAHGDGARDGLHRRRRRAAGRVRPLALTAAVYRLRQRTLVTCKYNRV